MHRLNRTFCMVAVIGVCVGIMEMVSPAQEQSPSVQTKVTETKEKGRFKRVEEAYKGGVLISRTTKSGDEKTGVPDLVTVKLFDGGTNTFFSADDKKRYGTVRSYYANDKLVVQEGDEDDDGFFETLILFDANEMPAEAFERSKDGTVTAFSKEKLGALKKTFSFGK